MLTRSRMCGLAAAIGAVLCLSALRAGFAQDILKELESAERSQSQGHSGHSDHSGHGGTPTGTKQGATKQKQHEGHQHAAPGQKKKPAEAGHEHQHGMQGLLGPYPISREGSGTSWVPEASPHYGVHATYGDWQTMYHALFNVVYDHQGGPRGGDKTFLNGMFMAMAERPVGEGVLGLARHAFA